VLEECFIISLYLFNLNIFNNTIPKLTVVQCVRKVAVHLQQLFEVMSTSVYTGLNVFKFIFKHLLQICIWKTTVHL
jgi:hypothetical protein